MKNILFLFLFLFSLKLSIAQNYETVEVNQIMLNNDTLITFPRINNCKYADSINRHLNIYLQRYFLCYNIDCVEDCILEATKDGLFKLHYIPCFSDSTVSFIIDMAIKKEDVVKNHRYYLTYSLKTGKQLAIEDLFPDYRECDIYNYLLRAGDKALDIIYRDLYDRYKEGSIAQQDYEILKYRLRYFCFNSMWESFAVSKSTLLLDLGCFIPDELSEYVPSHIRIDINLMRSELEIGSE